MVTIKRNEINCSTGNIEVAITKNTQTSCPLEYVQRKPASVNGTGSSKSIPKSQSEKLISGDGEKWFVEEMLSP